MAFQRELHTLLFATLRFSRVTPQFLTLLTGLDDVNQRSQDGDTLLTEAVHRQNTDDVRGLLTDTRIDVNCLDSGGLPPLTRSIFLHDTDTFDVLLAHPRINVNQRDTGFITSTPLLQAIEYKHEYQALRLLNHPAIDVTLTTSDGWTPLHYAVHNSPHVLVALLNNPAVQLNQQNDDGHTALMVAIQSYMPVETINVLVRQPTIDINVPDRFGRTALHYAVLASAGQYLPTLLAVKTIDRYASDRWGRTALMVAIANTAFKAIKLLLAGTGLAISDFLHWTPQTHRWHGAVYHMRVCTTLLAAQRCCLHLPTELWMLVFSYWSLEDDPAYRLQSLARNQALLTIVREHNASEIGVSIPELAFLLQQPINCVRTALNWLENEGHVYSTIDNDHFKYTCD